MMAKQKTIPYKSLKIFFSLLFSFSFGKAIWYTLSCLLTTQRRKNIFYINHLYKPISLPLGLIIFNIFLENWVYLYRNKYIDISEGIFLKSFLIS